MMMKKTEIKYLNTRTLFCTHYLANENNVTFSQSVSQMVNDPIYRTHLLKATHDGLTQKKIKFTQ